MSARPLHKPEDFAAHLAGSPEANQPEPTGPNAAKDRIALPDHLHGLPLEPDQEQAKAKQEAFGSADKPSLQGLAREQQRQLRGTGPAGPAAPRRGAEGLRKTGPSSLPQGPGAPAVVPDARRTDSGTPESQPPSAPGRSATPGPSPQGASAMGAGALPPTTLLWQPLVPLSRGAGTVELVLPPDARQVVGSAHILTTDGRCASVRLPLLLPDHRP